MLRTFLYDAQCCKNWELGSATGIQLVESRMSRESAIKSIKVCVTKMFVQLSGTDGFARWINKLTKIKITLIIQLSKIVFRI